MADEVAVPEQPVTETNPKPGFLDAIDRTTGEIKKPTTPAETPVTDTEPPKDRPKPNPEKAETAPSAEEKKDEPQKQEKAPEKAETAPTPVKPDLKTVLKDFDRKEVLKALELDDFDISFADYRKSGGKVERYLEAANRDWTKVSDIDVLRYDLRQEHPELDAENFEILAEARINERFILHDEFADDKKKKATALELKLAADSLRKKFAAEDKKFLIPEKQPDQAEAERLQKATQAKEDFFRIIDDSDATKTLLSQKKLKAGDGENAVQIDADPDKIMGFVKNEGQFFSLFQDTEGGLDVDLLYSTINYALNRRQYDKTLIDFGKSQGVKAETEELHNIPKETVPAPGDKKETLLQAFEKRGKDRML